jgi:hypothetical protein
MAIHESRRHVIAVETPSGAYKIFALGYNKRDGSLFIDLPYLKCDGLVGVATGIRNEAGGLSDCGFTPVGTTRHGIKFSYHPDGRTHFSQDGKIRTNLLHNGMALSKKTGPICTIIAHRLCGFTRVSQKDLREDPTKKGVWALTSSIELFGATFTVFLKSENDLKPPSSARLSSSVGMMTTSTRAITLPAIAIGQPSSDRGHDRVLIVAYRPLSGASVASESYLLFQGPYVECQGEAIPQGKLVTQSVVYPAHLGGDLVRSISSIDL